jgi:hypothetical protein
MATGRTQHTSSNPPESEESSITPAVSFTPAQLAECDEEHDSPVLGCPVCFLYLAYSQPMVDVGVETVRVAAEEGNRAARRALVDFLELRANLVQRHLRRPSVLLVLLLVFLGACSSAPLVAPPPPMLPGIPGQHWQLCLKLTEGAVKELILDEPTLAGSTTPAELACIRMKAAAECGYTFERLAADDTSGTVLTGEWCAADFAEGARRAVASRCGEDPGEFVDVMVEDIRQLMARRLAAALTRGQQ